MLKYGRAESTYFGKPSSLAQFAIFPSISVAGYSQMGPESSYIIGNKFETHTWTGDGSRLVGNHTIKFGATYRLNRVSNFRPNNPAGQYSFNDSWTRKVFNRTGEGDAIASMLLGLASGGQIRSEPVLALQVKYAAAYIQDDWRHSRKLTLNLGLRWDADFPASSRPRVEAPQYTFGNLGRFLPDNFGCTPGLSPF